MGGNGHLPNPLLEYRKRADFSYVPRIYGLEGHKGPKALSDGDMGARGGQGALAPTPPLEHENVLISVTYPGFLD